MSRSTPFALLLIVVLAGLAPLAQASPPDPLWIGGVFDGNDQDDVVIVATSGDGAVVVDARGGTDPLPVVPGDVPLPAAPAAPCSPRAAVQGRAPPTV